MRWHIVMLLMIVLGSVEQVCASNIFPLSESVLREHGKKVNVWWDGQTYFSGQIVAAACVVAMEDAWQVIDMGELPIRDLQNIHSGPEKRIQLRLRNCELFGTGDSGGIGHRVRVTFDGVQGVAPDTFSLSGQARGINLQVTDSQGYHARVGKIMPPHVLKGNEQGLNYTFRLVRNGEPLRTGDYFASLRFKVDYE